MKKITMKEKVLQFVEQRTADRYTDIIRFIVDTKFGEGTYDNNAKTGTKYVYNKKTGEAKRAPAQPYRGYYAAAFISYGRATRTGYFLTGKDYLTKIYNPGDADHGKYKTVRN